MVKNSTTVLELIRDLLLYNMTDNVYVVTTEGVPALFVENELQLGGRCDCESCTAIRVQLEPSTKEDNR